MKKLDLKKKKRKREIGSCEQRAPREKGENFENRREWVV